MTPGRLHSNPRAPGILVLVLAVVPRRVGGFRVLASLGRCDDKASITEWRFLSWNACLHRWYLLGWWDSPSDDGWTEVAT